MRIILIGQAAFGEQTLTCLLERSENVIAVYTLPDATGGRIDSLKQTAIEKGIKVLMNPPGLSSKSVIKKLSWPLPGSSSR